MPSAFSCQGVLFDLDGVLVDTRSAIENFWRQEADRMGLVLSRAFVHDHIHGVPARHTMDEMLALSGGSRHAAQEHALILERLRLSETQAAYRPIAGAQQLVRALASLGVPVALVTGAEPWKARAALAALKLTPHFPVVVTAADVRCGKPSPEGYRLAAQRLGLDAGHCIVFEDAVNGVLAAVGSDAMCIGVGSPAQAQGLLDAGARAVVQDFTRLQLQNTSSPGRVALAATEAAPAPLA